MTIEHLAGAYVVEGDARAVELARRRLDRLAARDVVDECARILERRLDSADESVWVISGLSASFAADLGAVDDRELTAAWARSLADELSAVLDGQRDAGAGAVRRYSDRAELAAEFAAALAAGQAWQTGEFMAFEGLRALPRGSAIRQALVRERPLAWPALMRLHADGRLEAVLTALDDAEARLLYAQACEGAHHAGPLSPLAAVVVAAWPGARGRAATGRDLVRLHAAALAARPDLPAAAPARVVPGLLALAKALDGAADPARLARALASGDTAGAVHLAAADGAEAVALAAALAAERADLERLAEAVMEAAHREPVARDDRLATLFGSVFMFLPPLVELGGETFDPLVRHRVLASCLGRERAAEAWHDPALRLASGCGRRDLDQAADRFEEVDTARVAGMDLPAVADADAEYLALADAGVPGGAAADIALLPLAAATLRGFAARLLGFATAGAPFLYDNFLAGTAVLAPLDGEIAVELPRVPLDVVLRMAGVDRQTFTVPWLDDAVVTLSLP